MQAPHGKVPSLSVCSQLPRYILQAMLSRFDAFSSNPESVREVTRAALSLIDSTMVAQQQLQAQVNQLQANMDQMAATLGPLLARPPGSEGAAGSQAGRQ